MLYRREGGSLLHRFHVLAFITDDLFRTRRTVVWGGYSKPLLRDSGSGQLAVENVPVPKPRRFPGVLANVLALKLLDSHVPIDFENEDARRLALAIFDSAKRLGAEFGSTLVLAYLPLIVDLPGGPHERTATKFRDWLASETKSREIAYVDLHEAFMRVPKGRRHRLYIGRVEARDGATLPPRIAGHFSTEGSGVVAREVAARLRSLMDVQP